MSYCIIFVLLNILLLSVTLTDSDVLKSNKYSSLEDRVSTLKEFSKKGVIKLNMQKFKEYIRATPRNYSFIVMLTAMEPQRHCSICSMVYYEFMEAIKSFKLQHGLTDKVFFGVVDFDNGGEVFQMLKINTAPVLMHFPAKKKMKNLDTMDMQRVGFSAEVIARWITDRTGFEFKVIRSSNYFGLLVLFAVFFIGTVLLYVKQESIALLKNTNAWCMLCVSFCLLMTSGQMWNHIRGPPFYHRSQNGVPVYIHGSSQGQFISETYIVFILNVTFVSSVIAIIESADSISIKRFLSLFSLIMAGLSFSLLLSIFRAKAGGYPYRAFF